MATLAELDTAIAQLKASDDALLTAITDIGVSVQKVDTDITALIARVQGTPGAVDVATELSSIQSENTRIVQATTDLANALASLNKADTDAKGV